MWREYFKLVGLVPGPVIIQGYGTIDFSDYKLSVETCKKLFEEDCEYLKITPKGRKELYGHRRKTTGKNKRNRS